MVTSILQYIIFLTVLYFFCKKLRIKDYFFLIATVSFMPISSGVFGYTVIQLFYLSNIIVVMISVIATFHFLEKDSFNTIDKVTIVLYLIFSLYIGISSSRFLICIHIPLLLMFLVLLIIRTFNYTTDDIIKHLKLNNIYSIVFCATMFNLFGYLFSIVVLKKNIIYWNFSVAFTTFNFDRVSRFFDLVLMSFGYNAGSNAFHPKSMGNYLSLLLVFLSIASMIYPLILDFKKKDYNLIYKFFNLFTIFSWLTIFVFYSFTNLYYSQKYILINTFLSIINIILFIIYLKISCFYKYFLTITLVFTLTINAFFIYKYFLNYDDNSERIYIKDFLIDKGYYNGLSTFLNGPILVELSNGKIDMWYTFNASDWKVTVNDSDHPLQVRAHDFTHPTGKVFIIMTNDEYEQVKFKEKLLDENLIYSSNKFHVYGFESYDVLAKNLSN